MSGYKVRPVVVLDGGRMRALREAAGMTMAAFGERAGLHPTSVSRFERGLRRFPTLETVDMIAAGLSVEREALLAEDQSDAETHLAKLRDRWHAGLIHGTKTHCVRGHILSGENVRMHKGSRQCQECKRIRVDEMTDDQRQAVWAKRRERERKTPERVQAQRRFTAENPEMCAAWNAVRVAMRQGKLLRPSACERCGRSWTRIEASHDDYSMPLEVEWLCVPCHRKKDRKLSGLRRSDRMPARSLVRQRKPGGIAALNAAKSECVNGHPYDEQNTRIRPNGHRACRACARRKTERERDAALERLLDS